MTAENSVPKAAIYIRVSTEEQWREGYSLSPPKNRGCANTAKEKAMRYLIYYIVRDTWEPKTARRFYANRS